MASPIAGVKLKVFKEDRVLRPESDGYLGELASGYIILEAEVEPGLPIYGFIRHGDDTYIPQKDWLNLPEGHEKSPKAWRRGLKDRMAGRKYPPGTKVYGVKMGLTGNKQAVPFVGYPNNMLCLAQYALDQRDMVTDDVNIWKVAIVSQDGKFFLVVDLAYTVTARTDDDGTICYPRFLPKHQSLNDMLVDWAPNGVQYSPRAEFQRDVEVEPVELGKKEAQVLRFYPARGIATLRLANGNIVRAYHDDMPARPRRQFLVPGEIVRYGHLGVPFNGKRDSSFEKQAYKLSLLTEDAGLEAAETELAAASS